MMKPILVLDVDGVIHSDATPWVAAHIIPDPPVTGALAFIQEALKEFRVAIFSSRSHQAGGIQAMKAWLLRWAQEDGKHIGNFEHVWLQEIEWPLHKPHALVTIDDRAIMFTGTWPALADLLAFKPWNKT